MLKVACVCSCPAAPLHIRLQHQPAMADAPPSVAWSSNRNSDDLWAHIEPAFSHARLYNSQKLLQNNAFGVRERHSPALGVAFRQRWAARSDYR